MNRSTRILIMHSRFHLVDLLQRLIFVNLVRGADQGEQGDDVVFAEGHHHRDSRVGSKAIVSTRSACQFYTKIVGRTLPISERTPVDIG